MAKASVKLICEVCGGTFIWSRQCGNREEANRVEKWARESITVCPQCSFEAKRKLENEKAKEKTEKLSLPQLEGSEKQIAWANTIRLKFVEVYEEENVLTARRYVSRCNVFESILRSETQATFWINKRNYTYRELIEGYVHNNNVQHL